MNADTTPGDEKPIRTVRTRWKGAVLVCGKCLKRHDDGKAVRRAIKGEIKARAKTEGRKARLVKTACIGLCPRKSVVLASPSTLAAGQVLLVRDESEVARAASQLLP